MPGESTSPNPAPENSTILSSSGVGSISTQSGKMVASHLVNNNWTTRSGSPPQSSLSLSLSFSRPTIPPIVSSPSSQSMSITSQMEEGVSVVSTAPLLFRETSLHEQEYLTTKPMTNHLNSTMNTTAHSNSNNDNTNNIVENNPSLSGPHPSRSPSPLPAVRLEVRDRSRTRTPSAAMSEPLEYIRKNGLNPPYEIRSILSVLFLTSSLAVYLWILITVPIPGSNSATTTSSSLSSSSPYSRTQSQTVLVTVLVVLWSWVVSLFIAMIHSDPVDAQLLVLDPISQKLVYRKEYFQRVGDLESPPAASCNSGDGSEGQDHPPDHRWCILCEVYV